MEVLEASAGFFGKIRWKLRFSGSFGGKANINDELGLDEGKPAGDLWR
jgi:hypothetical protein